MKTLFFNARLIDANTDVQGALLVEKGHIQKVLTGDISSFLNDEGIEKIDVLGNVVMPSFIDLHVHLRNPGQEAKETVESFLQSAVAGGFGTLVAMPNTNPVMSDPAIAKDLQEKVNALDMAELIQSLSLTKDFEGTDTSHLDTLQGFPLITEDGKDVASAYTMLEAMKKASKNNIVVSCHSEDPTLTEPAKLLRAQALELLKGHPATEWANYIDCDKKVDEYLQKANDYLALAEDLATERNIAIAKKAGCKVHIAHTSTKNCVDTIRRYKNEGGIHVTCEVMPHHFGLSSDDEGFLRYLVNPPIRNTEDKKALVEAIIDGTADVIATDHAPHTMEDKNAGAPGFSGLETSFAVSYTELVNTNKITLSKLSALMSKNAANILGLKNRGSLEKGMRADFVVVDTNCEWTVDSSQFKTLGKVCLFEGKILVGKVLQTWHKGKQVF